VESGAVTYRPSGTPEAASAATLGADIVLSAGDAAFEQHEAVSELRNLGDTPAVAVALVLLPPYLFS